MTTGFWIATGLAAWCLLAVLTGLLIGRMIKHRESASPVPSELRRAAPRLPTREPPPAHSAPSPDVPRPRGVGSAGVDPR